MRIAYVNSVVDFGSTGRLVRQLSEMKGVEGKIYYGRKNAKDEECTYKMTNLCGNSSHAIQTFLFDAQGFCNGSETKKMTEDLIRFQPDLIHLHNLQGYYLHVEILFAALRKMNVPVIWTFHDCWPFTGHCTHYEGLHCEKWKTHCEHCPGLLHFPYTFYGGNVEKNYNRKKKIFTSLGDRLTIVAPSLWMEKQIKASFLKNERVVLIPNGIDLSVFHPMKSSIKAELKLANQQVILGCSSVWSNDKGLDQMVRLSKDLPDNQVLVLVGVAKHQKKLFGPKAIVFERTDSVEQLVKLYSCADVFLNLTREDTFPTVNLEAMACGTPIIVTPVGGCPEVVVQQTGIVLKDRSYEQVLEVLKNVASGTLIFSREACVQKAQGYSLNEMLEKYQILYQKLLVKGEPNE